MLTNDQMKPNRYLRWHKSRRTVAAIVSHLNNGGMVAVTTATRQTRYTAKHASMFRAGKDGVYVQSGKSWVYIGFARLTFH